MPRAPAHAESGRDSKRSLGHIYSLHVAIDGRQDCESHFGRCAHGSGSTCSELVRVNLADCLEVSFLDLPIRCSAGIDG